MMLTKVFKNHLLFLLVSGVCLQTLPSYANEQIVDSILNSRESKRFIEPTSPILGPVLVKKIKDSKLSPSEIFQEISQSPEFKKEILISLKTYLETIEPGLDEYCKLDAIKTNEFGTLTVVEHAAIPLEVLTPFHPDYYEKLLSNKQEYNSLDGQELLNLEEELKVKSNSFQDKRYNCSTALKLKKLEDSIENLCLGIDACKKAKKLNSIVSSAEGAYPRIQFSINGFTRYVFSQLLKEDNLEHSLKNIYNFSAEWLQDKNIQNAGKDSLVSYVVSKSISAGIHPKTTLLILSYISRNMPSLDIEYGLDAKKALLLESYFWAFKDIRNTVDRADYLGKVYPNYNKDPGLYHYLTASLLSCEARLSGLNKTISLTLSYLSKLGYKSDKLLKAIDKSKLLTEGFSHVKALAKKQGFQTGLDAGEFGGEFGESVCGKMYDKNYKAYSSKLENIKDLYSLDVRTGYREVGPSGKSTKIPLTKKNQELRVKYLQEVQSVKNELNQNNMSLINE